MRNHDSGHPTKRRWRRFVYWSAGSLLVSVGLLVGAALFPRRWMIPASSDCQFPVYVVSDAMHVNLVLPVRTAVHDWNRLLPGAQRYRYLQFGWGDRIWYTETPSWEQAKWQDVARVLLYWNNSAAMLVVGQSEISRPAAATVQCLRLSQADYLALVRFITDSFERDPRQQIVRLSSTADAPNGFYAGTGRYSALRTCNSWAAEALQAANVNTPLWSGLAPPIRWQLRNGCTCDSITTTEPD